MHEPPTFVGVAFLRGKPDALWDRLIMDTTFGPFVHAEFFLQRGEEMRFYTAANLVEPGRRPSGFLPSARLRRAPDPTQWSVVRYPVSREAYLLTYSFVLQLIALNLPYNYKDLWQCSLKLFLPFERDLDCARPETWRPSGVFCSQVCLLLLRRLHGHGALPTLPLPAAARLHAVNSRGCSPNALYRLLVPEKKGTNQGMDPLICPLDNRI